MSFFYCYKKIEELRISPFQCPLRFSIIDSEYINHVSVIETAALVDVSLILQNVGGEEILGKPSGKLRRWKVEQVVLVW